MHLKTPNPNARPVVEGKRERDLASLEGKMSALMLSTYGTLEKDLPPSPTRSDLMFGTFSFPEVADRRLRGGW
jgi:hypothetical protein